MGAFDDIINAFSRFTGGSEPVMINPSKDLNEAVDAGVPISVSQTRKTQTPTFMYRHEKPTWTGFYTETDPTKVIRRMATRPGDDEASRRRGQTLLDLIRSDPNFNYRTGMITVNAIRNPTIEQLDKEIGNVVRHESSHALIGPEMPNTFHPTPTMEMPIIRFMNERYPLNYWSADKGTSAIYDEALAHIAGARSPEDYPVANPKLFADTVLQSMPSHVRERITKKWWTLPTQENKAWMYVQQEGAER